MTHPDPSERWRDLDAPAAPTERSEPSGPSPYETYPWAAVGGAPLAPQHPPYPVAPTHGPLSTPAPLPIQHPSAGTALALGVVGTVGGMLCGLPLLASPVAVVLGRRALREIDASNGALTGRGAATTGVVLGSLGSALLAIAVLVLILAVA